MSSDQWKNFFMFFSLYSCVGIMSLLPFLIIGSHVHLRSFVVTGYLHVNSGQTFFLFLLISNSTFKEGMNVIQAIAIYDLAVKFQFILFLPAAIVFKTLGYKRLILCFSSLL